MYAMYGKEKDRSYYPTHRAIATLFCFLIFVVMILSSARVPGRNFNSVWDDDDSGKGQGLWGKKRVFVVRALFSAATVATTAFLPLDDAMIPAMTLQPDREGGGSAARRMGGARLERKPTVLGSPTGSMVGRHVRREAEGYKVRQQDPPYTHQVSWLAWSGKQVRACYASGFWTIWFRSKQANTNSSCPN